MTTRSQPYNSFQKNFNCIIVAAVKWFIFFIELLNKAVGRESKDVAGPFADMYVGVSCARRSHCVGATTNTHNHTTSPPAGAVR